MASHGSQAAYAVLTAICILVSILGTASKGRLTC